MAVPQARTLEWVAISFTPKLLCPWNSPCKNTRVGCHSLLQGIFLTQGLNPGLLHCRQILYCLSYREIPNSPWNSLGQNTGVGSHSILQGIFPTQGSNPGLPHCGQILYHLSHKGSPRILEWVAYPFSSGSS